MTLLIVSIFYKTNSFSQRLLLLTLGVINAKTSKLKPHLKDDIIKVKPGAGNFNPKKKMKSVEIAFSLMGMYKV